MRKILFAASAFSATLVYGRPSRPQDASKDAFGIPVRDLPDVVSGILQEVANSDDLSTPQLDGLQNIDIASFSSVFQDKLLPIDKANDGVLSSDDIKLLDADLPGVVFGSLKDAITKYVMQQDTGYPTQAVHDVVENFLESRDLDQSNDLVPTIDLSRIIITIGRLVSNQILGNQGKPNEGKPNVDVGPGNDGKPDWGNHDHKWGNDNTQGKPNVNVGPGNDGKPDWGNHDHQWGNENKQQLKKLWWILKNTKNVEDLVASLNLSLDEQQLESLKTLATFLHIADRYGKELKDNLNDGFLESSVVINAEEVDIQLPLMGVANADFTGNSNDLLPFDNKDNTFAYWTVKGVDQEIRAVLSGSAGIPGFYIDILEFLQQPSIWKFGDNEGPTYVPNDFNATEIHELFHEILGAMAAKYDQPMNGEGKPNHHQHHHDQGKPMPPKTPDVYMQIMNQIIGNTTAGDNNPSDIMALIDILRQLPNFATGTRRHRGSKNEDDEVKEDMDALKGVVMDPHTKVIMSWRKKGKSYMRVARVLGLVKGPEVDENGTVSWTWAVRTYDLSHPFKNEVVKNPVLFVNDVMCNRDGECRSKCGHDHRDQGDNGMDKPDRPGHHHDDNGMDKPDRPHHQHKQYGGQTQNGPMGDGPMTGSYGPQSGNGGNGGLDQGHYNKDNDNDDDDN